MLRLVIEDGEGTTHVVPLIRDEITIGRQEGNTIRLTERNVSRRHARLVRAGTDTSPTVLVEDLDSYNGVRLNGDRITGKGTMRPADLLQIGDYSLALKTEEALGDDLSLAGHVALQEEAPAPVPEVRLDESERGRFVVVSSNLAGSEYALDRREVIIGRTESDENDLVIAHRSISRHHAKVIHRDGTFTIIDLASSNGVKVNGEAFGTATLVNGDIIELGHVKLRFCAPGDDYVFTSADVDDVEVEGGPGVWQMVFVALLLVGVSIVAFLIVDRMNRDRVVDPPVTTVTPPVTPVTPPPVAPPDPVPPAVDVGPDLAAARAAVEAEQWDDAIAAYDRVLDADPDNSEARDGRDLAQRERANKDRFDRLVGTINDKKWAIALDRLGDIPKDSLYHERVETYRPKVEKGYADAELDRGRGHVDDDRLADAERIHAALAARPFATPQARQLREAIDARRAAPAPERPTPERPTPERPTPERPATPDPKPDPTPKPPPRRPRVADDSYENLELRGLEAMGKGDRERAIVLFEQAKAARPKAKMPYQRLCAVHKARGDAGSALPNCEKWLQLETDEFVREQIERTINQLKGN